MTEETAKRQATLWWTLTLVVALTFLVVASNDAIYNLTSPPGPLQILLRKSYSIGAFAIVGYLFSRALAASNLRRSVLFVAIAVGAYSLLIEIVQALVGSQEGLVWNGVDVIFGSIGGYLGAIIERLLSRS